MRLGLAARVWVGQECTRRRDLLFRPEGAEQAPAPPGWASSGPVRQTSRHLCRLLQRANSYGGPPRQAHPQCVNPTGEDKKIMTSEFSIPPDAVALIAELRDQLKLTQAQLALAAGLDQSRVSRIEKGEVSSVPDVLKLLDTLAARGATEAREYSLFVRRSWARLDRPAFRNPQRISLESADQTLLQIDEFLEMERETEIPWPLARQLERQRDAIRAAAGYLQNLSHQVALIGDVGVGKSTAISVMFDLLGPIRPDSTLLNRVVLETGSGRTTICEIHLRPGPEHGIYVQPQTEAEIRALVSDFCADVWVKNRDGHQDSDTAVSFSEELGRAIRNMAGIAVRRERQSEGRRTSRDLAAELAKACASEDEFRARVLDRMQLGRRSRNELWFEAGPGRHPLDWMARTFKEINNGRHADIALPRRIDLLVPGFARELAPLEVTLVDSKGVDDIAIRPDLDQRLTDGRTLVVLCSRFTDAPGTTAQVLLKHMQQSLAKKVDDGRVMILALPRPGEATNVKDDSGATAEDDADGYDLKREQIERSLGKDSLGGAPVLFFNASSDDPEKVRNALLARLSQMRETHAARVSNLAATVDDLVKNHEAQAVAAAVEEVARRLRTFLGSSEGLRTRERHAYEEVMTQIDRARYASTLWASLRREGDYNGFNVYHHLGVGASTDGLLRCRLWFDDLLAHVRLMKADPGLALAGGVLGQIESNAQDWRSTFAESARTAGSEVYREPMQQAADLWARCVGEWGRGPGFKQRVKAHLRGWFDEEEKLKDRIEEILDARFRETVVRRLEVLCEETSAEEEIEGPTNVVRLGSQGAPAA